MADGSALDQGLLDRHFGQIVEGKTPPELPAQSAGRRHSKSNRKLGTAATATTTTTTAIAQSTSSTAAPRLSKSSSKSSAEMKRQRRHTTSEKNDASLDSDSVQPRQRIPSLMKEKMGKESQKSFHASKSDDASPFGNESSSNASSDLSERSVPETKVNLRASAPVRVRRKDKDENETGKGKGKAGSPSVRRSATVGGLQRQPAVLVTNDVGEPDGPLPQRYRRGQNSSKMSKFLGYNVSADTGSAVDSELDPKLRKVQEQFRVRFGLPNESLVSSWSLKYIGSQLSPNGNPATPVPTGVQIDATICVKGHFFIGQTHVCFYGDVGDITQIYRLADIVTVSRSGNSSVEVMTPQFVHSYYISMLKAGSFFAALEAQLPARRLSLHAAITAGDIARVQVLLRPNPKHVIRGSVEEVPPAGSPSISHGKSHRRTPSDMGKAATLRFLSATVLSDSKSITQAPTPNDATFYDVSLDEFDELEGQLPIHAALKSGSHDIMMRFLDFYEMCNLDLNVRDSLDFTPLHIAVSYAPKTKIVRRMLGFDGIDVTLVNRGGNTPLHYFCEKFRSPNSVEELCERLIEMSEQRAESSRSVNASNLSTVNMKNAAGETPLHKAVLNDAVRLLLVEILLRHKADPNIPNTASGETPIFYAVRSNRIDLMEVLVHAGADFSTLKSTSRDFPGCSALALAKELGHTEIFDNLTKFENLRLWVIEKSPDHDPTEAVPKLYLAFLREALDLDLLCQAASGDMIDMILDDVGLTAAGPRLRFRQALQSLAAQSAPAPTKLTAASLDSSDDDNDNSDAEGSAASISAVQEEIGKGNWQIDHADLEFTKRIASGAFGKVFRGLYRGKVCAIKVQKAGNMDRGALRDFEKEFAIMSVVKGPHICRFMGATVVPKVCMVLEFCDRGSLYHVLSSNNILIDWPEAVRYARELVTSLATLHTWTPQVLHRDMKSLNLLVADNWRLKLTDFGASRFKTADQMRTLQNMAGTISWTAPEVFGGDGTTDRSDVFSCGIIMWEIIQRVDSGSYAQPYKEFNFIQSDVQIMGQVVEGLRPTLPNPEGRTVGKDLVAGIVKLIARMWAPEPTDRPSILDVGAELDVLAFAIALGSRWPKAADSEAIEDVLDQSTGLVSGRAAVTKKLVSGVAPRNLPSNSSSTGNATPSLVRKGLRR